MKKISLTIVLLLYSMESFAACTKNDLTGTWMIYLSNSSNRSCTLNVIANGSLKGSSVCQEVSSWWGGDEKLTFITVTGTLNIDSTCHVSGTVVYHYIEPDINGRVIPDDSEKVNAHISKGKDSIVGNTTNKAITDGDTFSGIKL